MTAVTMQASRGFSINRMLRRHGGLAMALAVFVVIESRTAHPLLPTRIYTERNRAGSFLTSLLADAGIAAILLDGHTSAVEGSIGAIPRRLAVAAEDERRARQVLQEAGEMP